MHNLQAWMTANKESDETLAEKLSMSRVQVSRIRRGINGASKATALKLEDLTGIPWHAFIEPASKAPTKPEGLTV